VFYASVPPRIENEMGVLGFYKLFKSLKDATKKAPSSKTQIEMW